MGIGSSSEKNSSIKTNLRKAIKSSYIFNEIFSYLSENIKLKLINYNKKYQQKLGINIDHYKNISYKYKIGERKGIGMEYNINNLLLFKGKYLNGKKNGKGQEY